MSPCVSSNRSTICKIKGYEDLEGTAGLLFWRRKIKKLRVTKAKYMIEQINMDIVICRYNTGGNIYIVWARAGGCCSECDPNTFNQF